MATFTEKYIECPYKLRGHGVMEVKNIIPALEAAAAKYRAPDFYGQGQIIEDFESRISKLTGHEATIFMPSGTMAQQIALKIWSEGREKEIGYHATSHLEIHEQQAIRELHHLTPIIIGNENEPFLKEDFEKIKEQMSSVLIELPQRELGGALMTWDELVELTTAIRSSGSRVHLDGARLWECTPYYQKSISEICSLFDSVYLSYYKGIGAVAGATLSGPKDFIEESKVWLRRHGGNLISLYPYVASADFNLNNRLEKMPAYVAKAKEVSGILKKYDKVSIRPKEVRTNMFHLYIDDNNFPERAELAMDKFGFGFIAKVVDEKKPFKIEISIGDSALTIPSDTLKEALDFIFRGEN